MKLEYITLHCNSIEDCFKETRELSKDFLFLKSKGMLQDIMGIRIKANHPTGELSAYVEVLVYEVKYGNHR
jgi:hypothetical protein